MAIVKLKTVILVMAGFLTGYLACSNLVHLKRLYVYLFVTPNNWDEDILEVDIASSSNDDFQKAKAFFSHDKDRPLILSLHSWGGDFNEADPIAKFAIDNDYNYIHPDFRGPNNSLDSCCSDSVISDIDDAITYMLQKGASKDNIYVIGLSGGGYTVFCTYLKSRYNARHYSAWASILT